MPKEIRKPAVAGSFYSSDKEELKKQIKEAFLSKLGPGKLPSDKRKDIKGDVKGIIVPHAGYAFSAACAAHAYKKIAESSKPNLYIILGTNHSGQGNADFMLSEQDFETPFGEVWIDRIFKRRLIDKSVNLSLEVNEFAHSHEHSIEVQLPFLQFINPGAKILPIMVNKTVYEKYDKFSRIIANLAKELGKRILVIASSDFTHYGNYYGFVPFKENVKENLYKLDKKIIDLILKFKTQKFLKEAEKTTICGTGAIALAIEICKQLGSKSANLLKYYTSGDVSGDYNMAVGYAGISFS